MPKSILSSSTLKSVAAAAGVSRQTVSNVINAPEKVAPETLDRVRAVIEAQDYRPNSSARSLRTRASRQLGYSVAPLNPVLDRFVHTITAAADEHGFHILLFAAPSGADGLGKYGELLAQHAVDGFILSETVVGDPRQEWLIERGVPFVAFGRTWRNEERGAWVDVDGAAGVARAVEHVYQLGHRRIAFIGWPEGSGVGDDRLAGYRRACAKLGVTPTVVRDVGIEQGWALAGQLLDGRQPPTALICVSDLDALGAIRAVVERGLRPGHDVAITGFDDTPSAALPGVDLTSVGQPIEAAGRMVVDLLLAQVRGNEGGARHRLLEPSLAVRSSTKPSTSGEASR